MSQPIAASRGEHWAQINEFSFLTGMRLLYWLARLFGRWPFRLLLYPVVLWYLIAKPAARRASKAYLKRLTSSNSARRNRLRNDRRIAPFRLVRRKHSR